MEQLSRKICLFLFLIAILAGKTTVLGTVVGAITGTILLWPVYARVIAAPVKRESETMVKTEHGELLTP